MIITTAPGISVLQFNPVVPHMVPVPTVSVSPGSLFERKFPGPSPEAPGMGPSDLSFDR